MSGGCPPAEETRKETNNAVDDDDTDDDDDDGGVSTCEFRVACVQFEPAHGDRTKSFEKCLRMLDEHEQMMLSSSSVVAPLSIIQFPEMCFTGYTFDSREEIEPFVEWDDEEEEEAVTRQFLSSVAKRFNCLASAGYVRGIRDAGRKLYYNAVQVVDEAGRVILRANKHHLYCIDETWADEDIENGFTSLELVLKARGIGNTNSSRSSRSSGSSKVEEYRIKTTVGICMDINPYKFEAPWGAFEFAKTIEKASSSLVLFASAWTNAHPDDDAETKAIVPDRTETWNYWFNRLLPLFVDQEKEGEEGIIRPRKRAFVFANRVGVEHEIHFVGSSVVFQIERGGKLIVKGGLDNKKEGILVARVECNGVKVL
ncbi:unnamed protein product [Bathycoccus prasinos]